MSTTTYETPSDTEIVITRVFDAPRRLVFAAWTEPEHLPHWFGRRGWTLPVCEVDLRPGGAWRFVHRGPDGSELAMSGVYRAVDPPERLVYTESYDGGRTATVNTVHFDEQEDRTTITCTIRYPSRESRDAVLTTGMRQGTTEGFNRLADYLRDLDKEQS
ncbi:MAG TPA: SRPBCC family protein [Kribbella sp.]|nr:SRPBCC family protein [Kribbella sp.]